MLTAHFLMGLAVFAHIRAMLSDPGRVYIRTFVYVNNNNLAVSGGGCV